MMACVCSRVLKLAVDFTSFGNGGLRACCKSLQSISICASGAPNGVFYSNAAVELQQEPSSPQREIVAAASGENPLKLEWKETSRRTGVIAIKLGMTQLWNKEGYPVAVTVLQVIDNQVVKVKRKTTDGYTALQIGAINHPKIKRVLKPVLGQFQKAGVPPKRKLWEFRVSSDALLPVGTPLHAGHFVPGQYVDVCSTSIGKGFQGVMKRHGMKGQPASHGVTKTHRKMGATGGGQEPGRIWPGKKMPGRMGGKRVTMPSLKVYRINHRFNVLYVRGPVPGHKTTYVRVTDAKRKPHSTPPPFPTFFPDPNLTLPEENYSDDIHIPHDPTIEFPDKSQEKKKR